MELAPAARLTEWTKCGGCAAKWSGARLSEIVDQVGNHQDESSLLVGLSPFDDAAVYQLSEQVALVSTVDFFPPLVEDPADFGAIAAANACSDVFAMGGDVFLALNIAALPEHLAPSAIASMFAASSAIVRQAGGSIAGGHTIRSAEPMFGLAVQGLVDPQNIHRKSGAMPGDTLVLSKPLGTGIVLAGGSQSDIKSVIRGMRTLNRRASRRLRDLGSSVHAVTDVTGFGLLGHGWEIAERSGVTAVFDSQQLPLYPGAYAAACAGAHTGGDARNREYLGTSVHSSASLEYEALAFDPQTSGGLLAAVAPLATSQLTKVGFTVVGYVEAGESLVVLL
jgi:selenide, water dikinase